MSIFLLLSLGLSYAFEQRPQNTVVKIGESFELSCEHGSQQTDWYLRRLLTANDRNHEQTVKETNRTRIYKDKNATKLAVSSAEVNDAGIYTCLVVTDRMTTEQSAAVVEVISDATCAFDGKTTLSETDKIEIRCTFSHYGPARPVVRWKQVAADGAKDLSSANTVIMHSTTSQLSASADVTMLRSEFRLEASFDLGHLQSSHSQNMANNTLDLRLWKSPDIRVIYGPSNLIIRPPDGVLRANEQATCYAEGNPRPNVEWINAKTMRVVRGPTLTADEISAGHSQSAFTCRAINSETNRTASVTIDFKVVKALPNTTMEDGTEALLDWPNTTSNDKVDKEYMMAKVFLPAFCLSLAITGGLIVYIISRKRKKRNKETVRVKAILRGRQIAPTCSASQQVFPQGVTKLQPIDEDDNYLSPRPDLTATTTTACDDDNNYEELPDMKSLSVHNIVYFEFPSSKSLPLPSTPDVPSGPRTCNDYMEISECEPNPRGKIYESLRRK